MAMPFADDAPPGGKTLHKSYGYKFSLFSFYAAFFEKEKCRRCGKFFPKEDFVVFCGCFQEAGKAGAQNEGRRKKGLM